MKQNIKEKDITILNEKLFETLLDPQDEEDNCFMLDRKTVSNLIKVLEQYDTVIRLLENVDENYLYINHTSLWTKTKSYREVKGERK